jgi:hypothetical protein
MRQRGSQVKRHERLAPVLDCVNANLKRAHHAWVMFTFLNRLFSPMAHGR